VLALSGWMLYTMWAVLGLIGLNWLVDLYRSMVSGTLSLGSLTDWLGDLTTHVFPLLLLVLLLAVDPTGWLVLCGYYVGGVGIVLKLLFALKKKLF